MKRIKFLPFSQCNFNQKIARTTIFIVVVSILTILICSRDVNPAAAKDGNMREAHITDGTAKISSTETPYTYKETVEQKLEEPEEPIEEPEEEPIEEPEEEPIEEPEEEPIEEPEEESVEESKTTTAKGYFSEEDIIILAKTLYGEAYCVDSRCERSMVIWTILNRLDSGLFGDTIAEICTAHLQFTGYLASNPVTDRCLEEVYDVLDRWLAEKAGEENVGRTLPRWYYYFVADSIPSQGIWHNKFYAHEYGVYGDIYVYDRDNPIDNPY